MINIDGIIKSKGISKKELAIKMGVSKVMLYRILSGNPTLNNITKLAATLDVPITELFDARSMDIAPVKSSPAISSAEDISAATDTLKQIAVALKIPIKEVFEQSPNNAVCPHCGGRIKLCKGDV